jgi:hypothetical protein
MLRRLSWQYSIFVKTCNALMVTKGQPEYNAKNIPLIFKLSKQLNLRIEDSSVSFIVELERFSSLRRKDPRKQRPPMVPSKRLRSSCFSSRNVPIYLKHI